MEKKLNVLRVIAQLMLFAGNAAIVAALYAMFGTGAMLVGVGVSLLFWGYAIAYALSKGVGDGRPAKRD